MEDEPLLTDLIPKRLGTYWLIFVLSSLFIIGLEFCFFKMPVWATEMKVETITAFDVTQHGNLYTWFSSTLWFLAALYAAIIYKLGQEEDDGRHLSDIWIWVALLTLFMSIDRAAGFHLVFRDIMIYATGTMLYGNGTLWWISIYAFVFIVVGSRVLVEMRMYLPACNALLMCGICHIVTICAMLNLIYPEDAVKKTMLLSGSEMFGNVFLFLAFGLFGRRLIIGDPLTYRAWNFSFWRRLTRRITPTRYNYQTAECDYDHPERVPHYRRQRTNTRKVRSMNNDWDEDEETYTAREPHYSRKQRLKKSQRGVFY